MDLWDDVTIKDFDDDPMAALIEVVGLETAKRLVVAFGGDSFYFPKVESVIRTARDRRIRSEFTGFNHKELAAKYNLTPRYVRKIVGADQPIRIKKETQLDLF